MINKNLLYTAITRAKNKIGIISNKDILEYGINNSIIRKSLLEHMICYYYSNCNSDFNDYYCNI